MQLEDTKAYFQEGQDIISFQFLKDHFNCYVWPWGLEVELRTRVDAENSLVKTPL